MTPPIKIRWLYHPLLFATIFGGVTVSILIWKFTEKHIQETEQARFQSLANETIKTIQHRIDTYHAILRSGIGLFKHSPDLTNADWKAFVEALEIDNNYPGMQGIGYSVKIPKDQLQNHVSKMTADGYLNYKVHPEGERDIYTSIIYLEPLDIRNQKAIGYDMFSEPVRRLAMQNARDSNKAAVSGRVILVQEIDENVQAGFLMYAPLYQNGPPINTVEQRRKAIKGYVYCPFRAEKFIESIFPEQLPELDLAIFDGDQMTEDKLLYSSFKKTNIENSTSIQFSTTKVLDIYGNQWTFFLRSKPKFLPLTENYLPFALFIIFSVMSFLLGLLVWIQGNVQASARELKKEVKIRKHTQEKLESLNKNLEQRVKERTADLESISQGLQESEDRFRAMVSSIRDYAMFMIDTNGIIISWNEGAKRLTGFDHADVIGAHFFKLHLPEETKTTSLSGFLSANSKKGQIEHTGWRLRKDGTKYWATSVIAPVLGINGELVAYSKIIHDITEKKNAEEFLILSEERVRLATEVAELGIWDWDIQSGLINWNDRMFDIYGITKTSSSTVSYQQWKNAINKTDLHIVESHLDYSIQHGKRGEFEFSITRINDHTHRIIHAIEIGITNEENKVVRLVGINLDITDRRTKELELKSLNNELEQRVTERTKEMEHARDMANAANKAKSEFLSRMSHELRTPLNGIIGFSKLLGMDNLTQKQKNNAKRIHEGGVHLLELINEVLDISRIEAGHLTLSPESVDAYELCMDVIGLVEPMAMERNITLHWECSPKCTTRVIADRQRLKQVLLNLASNAIKYNKNEGQVTFSMASRDEHHLIIDVIDTGIGIDPAKIKRLFSPFDRLDIEKSGNTTEGTGLGLALSKKLVEAMGGILSARNNDADGSVFSITLNVSSGDNFIHNERSVLLLNSTPNLHSDRSAQTILCIEDNPDNLTLFEQILDLRPKLKLLSAIQGLQGIELARQHMPAVIFLDFHLPDINGDEVLTRLKSEKITSKIPVFMISADVRKEQKLRLKELGAEGYLTKPLDIEQFLELLDKIL